MTTRLCPMTSTWRYVTTNKHLAAACSNTDSYKVLRLLSKVLVQQRNVVPAINHTFLSFFFSFPWLVILFVPLVKFFNLSHPWVSVPQMREAEEFHCSINSWQKIVYLQYLHLFILKSCCHPKANDLCVYLEHVSYLNILNSPTKCISSL